MPVSPASTTAARAAAHACRRWTLPLLGLLLAASWQAWAAATGAVTGAAPSGSGAPPDAALARLDPALHPALTGRVALPAEVLVWFHAGPEADMDAARREQNPRGVERRRRAIAGSRAALHERLRRKSRAPHFRRSFRHIAAVVVPIRDRQALLDLASDPAVRHVEPERWLVPHATQSLQLIDQPTALARGLTGAGTSVVVLDTGVNFTHPTFGCTAPGVPAGCRVRHAQDIAVDDGQLDSNGHGSNVAGIVAAVAPGAGIVALDVFSGTTAALSDVLAGIDWAIAERNVHAIAAINISIGLPGTRHLGDCPSVIDGYTAGGVPIHGFFNPFQEAFAAATAAGISVVTSAGNEAFLDGLPLPACTPHAIAVGAVYDAALGTRSWAACTDPTTAADQVACFSNASGGLDLLAPGALVTAAGSTWGGTSQAAPHVAAAVTLVRQAFPGLAPAGVRDHLVATGRPVTDARGIPVRIFPRLDLAAAFPVPPNDDFARATPLAGDALAVSGSNVFATREADEPLHAGLAGGGSLWFTWTPGSSRSFRLRTTGSSFDTLIAVYQGEALGSLAPLASDDDGAGGGQSQLVLAASAGQVYRIAVDGKAGARGSLLLDIVPLDSADRAVSLLPVPARIAVATPALARATVRNAGPAASAGTLLALGLPGGVTAPDPWPAGCAPGGPGLLCSLGELAAGAERVLEIPVVAPLAGEYALTAEVSGSTPDLRNGDDLALATLVAAVPADLGVTLSPLPATLATGARFSATVQLTNAGPGPAGGTSLSLRLTGGGGVATAPAGCTARAGGEWACGLGELLAGAFLEQAWEFFSFTPGPFTVTATIASGTVDPSPGNDLATATSLVVDRPDLALTLATASPPPGVTGTGLRATVMNVGPGAASDIRLRIPLPAGVWLNGSNGQCTQTATLAECRLGALAGETGPATVLLALIAGQPGQHTLTARVSAAETDAEPANDSATISLAVVAGPVPGRQIPAVPGWLQAGLCAALLARGLLRMAAVGGTRRGARSSLPLEP